ncbi:MAG TPA: nuclear transport factor 2 family protein [Opitutaceae bacterium]|nr:nuclear transport factor 2 family protein [Opitutaceae bacterium]
MSTAPNHVTTVQTMYAAFGRADMPGLLAHVSEDVDWRINVDPQAPGAAAVSDFRPFRGKKGVSEFFAIIGRDVEFHSFQPLSFLTGGNEVAVRVLFDGTIRPTGRRVKVEAIHHFTFNERGHVTRFLESFDTLAVAAAWNAVKAV